MTSQRLLTLAILLALAWPGLAGGRAAAADTADAAPDETAGAQEAVSRRWQRFVAALRAGDLPRAFASYTPQSRAVMGYEEFAAQHHPLTSYSEILLAEAVESRITVRRERAVLRFTPRLPEAARVVAEVKFFLVRDDEGRWLLVSPARWELASREADARALLKRLHARLAPLIVRHGHEDLAATVAAECPALLESPLYTAVTTAYELRYVASSPQAWIVHARPREEARGLRAFSIDAAGALRATPAPDGDAEGGEETGDGRGS